jgi:predicted acetyltransferase
MESMPKVSLDPAPRSDSVLLSNLLELYIHDLSEVFPDVQLGPDGPFGYEYLPLYWSEPERRFPFLIRYGGRLVGFILAKRGSEVTGDPDVLDVAEFFVMRRYRRLGLGRKAAFLLWNRLPGLWMVRVSERNPGALDFWRSTVAEFTNGAATESGYTKDTHYWRLFCFESVA